MQLYVERGYEQTTVVDIAALAGLTARTFFRHFADKREVLFSGTEPLLEQMAQALRDAPPDTEPLDAVGLALDIFATAFGADREYARARRDVIAATAELQERELIKYAAMAGSLAEGLRLRGVPEPEATLAAQAGIAVLRVGFAAWLDEPDTDLAQALKRAMGSMHGLIGADQS